jgi:uncharacterized protein YcaQ
VTRLRIAEARRIALAAQGFTGFRRPMARADRRHVLGVLDRVQLFQIDSVNVVVRSHYLPTFSRVGPYPRPLLERLTYRDRALFEYWGHEASLLPVSLHPLLRWRMARARRGETWGGMARLARERPEFVRAVFDEVAERGPISAGELTDPGEKRGPWWGWADGKRAMEWLFWSGELAVADRRAFERVYDLPERVIPAEVLSAPTPDEAEAHRALLLLAARAVGVGTAADLADYFRIKVPLARPRLAELVAAGELEMVDVDGWRDPAYLHPEAARPRRVNARALLSPFDSLIWFRPRAERLFDFRFRLEIYTPAHQRVHGYYVLPFVSGDRVVARVDVKADRKAGRLLVHAAHAETGVDHARVATALADELALLAHWLELTEVAVTPDGDLGPALASRCRRSGASP